MTDEYHGHLTHADGSHTTLTSEDAKTLLAECDRQRAKRAEDMPTSINALRSMSQAEERLSELGWSKGIYCPKDGSSFAVIQFGCTGIFDGGYVGEWPKGEIWIGDESMPPEAGMWKPIDKLDEAERAQMDRCTQDHKDFIGRLGNMAMGDEK